MHLKSVRLICHHHRAIGGHRRIVRRDAVLWLSFKEMGRGRITASLDRKCPGRTMRGYELVARAGTFSIRR
jgi:hypothetical protein